MAHDTKTLLRDGSGITPVPQFFNPTADDFRPLTGVDLGNGRYGADGLIWGKTSGGVYVPVKCNADGAVVTELSGSIPAGANEIGKVQLSGSKMELYGASLDDRPDATTVPIGTTFTIVDDTGNFDSYISDGTNWMEV